MALVCGVDCGSAKTPSYVAWLDTSSKEFVLDAYIPQFRINEVLPSFHHGVPSHIGLDCPQGLTVPGSGRIRRLSDQFAKTPTRRMALTRAELETAKLYGVPIVRLGIDLFWTIHLTKQATIYGLDGAEMNLQADPKTTVFETYPRFALETLFGLKPSIKHIPSKRNDAESYVQKVWGLIRELGYRCPSAGRLTNDDVDAMLCAIAAEQLSEGRHYQVGDGPTVDDEGEVLREGYIVVPTAPEK
jgi:predicted nuclease with RNAse H fold